MSREYKPILQYYARNTYGVLTYRKFCCVDGGKSAQLKYRVIYDSYVYIYVVC